MLLAAPCSRAVATMTKPHPIRFIPKQRRIAIVFVLVMDFRCYCVAVLAPRVLGKICMTRPLPSMAIHCLLCLIPLPSCILMSLTTTVAYCKLLTSRMLTCDAWFSCHINHLILLPLCPHPCTISLPYGIVYPHAHEKRHLLISQMPLYVFLQYYNTTYDLLIVTNLFITNRIAKTVLRMGTYSERPYKIINGEMTELVGGSRLDRVTAYYPFKGLNPVFSAKLLITRGISLFIFFFAFENNSQQNS